MEGYIEWDRKAYEMSQGPSFEEIRPVLELFERLLTEAPDG